MPWNTDLEPESPAYMFAISPAERIRTLAGPGTGKSFALKRRIARLLEEGAEPRRILAVTFTRTAAADLKSEIQALEIVGSELVIARTLHSLCFHILGREHVFQQLFRSPRPLLDHEIEPMLRDLPTCFGNISEKKRRILEYEAMWARLQNEEPGFAVTEIDQAFHNALINWLIYHKAMLIGELIPLTFRYLRDNPLCIERTMYDHVLVDEYQDLNKAEQLLIDYLVGAGTCTVIGDDDQSIYSFKFANPEGIRTYPDTRPQCETVEFAECLRCPSTVVDMASCLISNNHNRTLGRLVPHPGNDEGEVRILQWASLDDEIDGVSEVVNYLISQENLEPGDILILTPLRRFGYRIRNSLIDKGIAASSYFHEEALESSEAKSIYSLLSLAAWPEDMVSLRYLLGRLSQDYRSPAYARLKQAAEAQQCTLRGLLERLVSGETRVPYTGGIQNQYRETIEQIQAITRHLSTGPQHMIDMLTPEFNDDLEMLRNGLLSASEIIGDKVEPGDEQSWLQELVNETRDLISIPNIPDEIDHVRVMSLHASKGLSSKVVIITGCVQGLIPRLGHGESAPVMESRLQEQRRLFYVGMTRCKNQRGLYPGNLILSSFQRMDDGVALQNGIHPSRGTYMTSQFIGELGPVCPAPMAGTQYLQILSNR